MEKWNVLVITAHPDDEVSCGGTLAKLAEQGHSVTIAIATNGNRGTQDTSVKPEQLAQIREKEMADAARILGVNQVIQLGFDDGTLSEQPDLKERIFRLIRNEKPDVVITLDAWRKWEFHPDHRALGLAAAEAAYLADGYGYYPEHLEEGIQPWKPREVYLLWSDEPNYTVDVTDTWEAKLQAADSHVSQGSGGRTFKENYLRHVQSASKDGELRKTESFRKIYGSSYLI
ncbi:PIG-L deacetylase family protein [Paenibacillus sp. AR247]|uniref:PIG-L deacetylase family protein n=1 Tax=Paenibacillus sp. AR247 TaxID=1631599 RepID=UPI000CF9D1AD|nr:PIG-L deacetylase family protein [Paenibacillus sp. AR247]PQP90065.1 GlcNAc-PI de-N-acetylase [Paenibacillus sp. AR247]